MSFLTNMVEEFVEQRMAGSNNSSQQQQQQQQRPQESYYNEQSQQGDDYQRQQQGGYSSQPPQVPYPWIAEWDSPADRWIFINRETGYKTFEYPGGPQPQEGGRYEYRSGGDGYEYQNEGPGYQQRGEYFETQRPVEVVEEKSHTGRNVAIGAAAGMVGGASLMHEGEKVEEKWDEDKYRLEQEVSDIPSDTARWTGEAVQGVEDIPEDAAQWTGEAVQNVEDIPEDAAGWVGERDDGVERFGDEIEESYEEGRMEKQYNNEY